MEADSKVAINYHTLETEVIAELRDCAIIIWRGGGVLRLIGGA